MCKMLNKYFRVLHFKFHFVISPYLRPLSVFPCLPQYLLNPYLQVKTSDFSLQVLHLTKQHQWNLQLHCQTRV